MKKVLVSMALAALAAPLFAQTTVPARLAVIDVQRVLTTSTAGKAAYERLKKLQDDRVAKMQKMDDEVKGMANELNTKKLSLSDEKQAEMAKQIADKQTTMQRFAQDADKEVTDARDKALEELNKKIVPVVDVIGKEMGLAAIFNKFESGLIYASDAIDITDTVIKRFNESQAGTSPAPAATKKP
jgi:outer membrane protein